VGRRPRAWPLLLLIGLATCRQISRHELACEEAKARLVRCCPGFTGEALGCEDTTGEIWGCDQVELDLADAHCVTDRSCDALAAQGVCTRAIESFNGGPRVEWKARICALP